jgi:hypothetical protein
MITDIQSHEDGTYTLRVNGEPTVQRESFTVCDRIRYALEHPDAREPGECQEVADVILLNLPPERDIL